eukprot:781620-Prymnesium_polylepis.1
MTAAETAAACVVAVERPRRPARDAVDGGVIDLGQLGDGGEGAQGLLERVCKGAVDLGDEAGHVIDEDTPRCPSSRSSIVTLLDSSRTHWSSRGCLLRNNKSR